MRTQRGSCLQRCMERLLQSEIDKALDATASTVDLKKRAVIFEDITNGWRRTLRMSCCGRRFGLRLQKDIVWNVRNDDRVYAWELDRAKSAGQGMRSVPDIRQASGSRRCGNLTYRLKRAAQRICIEIMQVRGIMLKYIAGRCLQALSS